MTSKQMDIKINYRSCKNGKSYSKLNIVEKLKIIQEFADGTRTAEIAKSYGIHRNAVTQIKYKSEQIRLCLKFCKN